MKWTDSYLLFCIRLLTSILFTDNNLFPRFLPSWQQVQQLYDIQVCTYMQAVNCLRINEEKHYLSTKNIFFNKCQL
jgi:hypothetical protein